jgi:tetratricopeptide (TPR) repeat protein
VGAPTLVALGRSELGNGQLEESLAHLDAALELALTLDDARLTSDALSWRSRVCWLTGRWKEALASATSAIEALAGLPETVQLARALARRSQIEMLRGLPEAEAHSREAIEAGRRLGDEQAELNARINLLTARANKGVPPDDDDVREIVRRAAAAGLNDEAHRAVANMIWSAQAYRHADEVEAIVAELRETLAAVPPVENFREYIEVSLAALLHLPTGRWDALDDEARNERLPPRFGGTMVRLELLGGLALRRGDLAAAGVALRELRDVAIESGEAQRIVPMASVVLPLAALTDDITSYDLALSAVLRVEGREWEVMPTAGIPRALAAVGDAEGLERIAELLGPEDPAALSVPLRVARLLTTSLLATLGGRPQAGIEPILAAVELERARGWHYRAACLETELARVLETSGRRQEAAAARGRAAAVLGPLGVVNPY